ncbi:PTS sugar transporter subunit IIA [Ferrovum sp.]|uniref:PTS sugar transporter subunit IIA n=1 Tax=Ferrovum sp. TaxID=2609467 RepID=UPI002615DEFD|nr:PTS sugar transporter subunit IIA [Ferrovum sp.]
MGSAVPRLHQLLKLDHILLDLEVTSKKRLFEQIGILFENHDQLPRSQVFDALFNREKLGSTGLGHGFALPHGRMKGVRDTFAAFLRLSTEIPFEAPDGQPVRMVFALLVPEHANELHLRLLGEISELFSDESLRQHLLSVTDPLAVIQALSQPHALG